MSYIIQHGEVFDGTGSASIRADVRVGDGQIQEIGPSLTARPDEQIIDASGLIVAPGLIDLHAHVFTGMGDFSVDPADVGIRTGVTTLIDTGTAGALTYETFERAVIRPAAEDIYEFLCISRIGVLQNQLRPPHMGELADIRFIHVDSAVSCIERLPEFIKGVKVRLTDNLADNKREHEDAGFQGALAVAERTGLPVMVHHVGSLLTYQYVVGGLRSGDIYTHTYHTLADNAFAMNDGAPPPELLEARQRGVVFDVGHGAGSFAWDVVEPACQQHGFWPDTISTDVHKFNINGPVYDMATTMSKFLHLGMPLSDIIHASTYAAAQAARIADRSGLLAPGRIADVVLLKQESGQFELVDCRGRPQIASQRLRPVKTLKAGVLTECPDR